MSQLIWFTGISGAGKSTLSEAIYSRLTSAGVKTFLLDGDKLREGLCKDLGYSPADRSENIRRAGEVAKLLLDDGFVVLAAFMSPMAIDRDSVRNNVGCHQFIEVYCQCEFDVCVARDAKGFYKKAKELALKNIVGLDVIYEAPVNAEITINTAEVTIEKSILIIMDYLRKQLN